MKEISLDCQGLACPQPLLRCKETIQKQHPNRLQILVDNEAAKENVSRFLTNQAYQILSAENNNGIFTLNAESQNKQEEKISEPPSPETSPESPSATVQEEQQLVLITSDVMGQGDDNLGSKLMQNFIFTLPEMGNSLWRLILINGGVKLTITGSLVLEQLKKLENNGTSILVCGTCLDHFNLLDQKQVGETTNMLDVVTSLQLATKVIKV